MKNEIKITKDNIRARYDSIIQHRISENASNILKQIRKSSNSFKDADEKQIEAFSKLYHRILKEKPTAIKTTMAYRNERKQDAKKSENPKPTPAPEPEKPKEKKKFLSSRATNKERDASRKAKRPGYRIPGSNRVPLQSDIKKGNVYWEGRANRADVNRKGYPYLEKGGEIEIAERKTVLDEEGNKYEWLVVGFEDAQKLFDMDLSVFEIYEIDDGIEGQYGESMVEFKEDFDESREYAISPLELPKDFKFEGNAIKYSEGGDVGFGSSPFDFGDLKKKVKELFPDTFGLYLFEPDKTKLISDIDPDLSVSYYGIDETLLKEKLYFPHYVRDHFVNFKMTQGDENTYFDFIIQKESGDLLIAHFGFKDSEVEPETISRFINFLLQCYKVPVVPAYEMGGEMEYGTGNAMYRKGGNIGLKFIVYDDDTFEPITKEPVSYQAGLKKLNEIANQEEFQPIGLKEYNDWLKWYEVYYPRKKGQYQPIVYDKKAKGGSVNHANSEIASMTAMRAVAIDEFQKEYELSDEQMLKIATGLGRKHLSKVDFSAAVLGKKNNKYVKEVLKYASTDKYVRLGNGGTYAEGGLTSSMIKDKQHRIS